MESLYSSSQLLAANPYREPDKSNSCHSIVFLLNIILPLTPTPHKLLGFLQDLFQNGGCSSVLSLLAIWPTSLFPIHFVFPIRRVGIIKLLIMQFSPVSSYFLFPQYAVKLISSCVNYVTDHLFINKI